MIACDLTVKVCSLNPTSVVLIGSVHSGKDVSLIALWRCQITGPDDDNFCVTLILCRASAGALTILHQVTEGNAGNCS